MRDLQDRLGLTYLFISHNLAVVRHMATRIGVMYLGRLVEIAAATGSVRRAPQHPYTRMLLDAVPDLGPCRPRTRVPVSGEIPNPIDPPPGCTFNPRCPLRERPLPRRGPGRSSRAWPATPCRRGGPDRGGEGRRLFLPAADLADAAGRTPPVERLRRGGRGSAGLASGPSAPRGRSRSPCAPSLARADLPDEDIAAAIGETPRPRRLEAGNLLDVYAVAIRRGR